MFSLIIPAHNEETTIGRCLAGLLSDARPGELEIVVVCNGCSDRTADVARSFGPAVTVVEIGVASKYLALRAGDERASGSIRFYIDADVVAGTQAVREVGAVLERGDALVAAPRLRIDLGASPWYVRSYYRLWTQIPYAEDRMVGTGFYAFSEAGRARFGEFPDVIADDQFVLSRFSEAERCSVDGAEFVMSAPTTWLGLLHRKTRSFTGNRQLEQRFGDSGAQSGGRHAWAGVVCRRPWLLSSLPIYLLVCAIAEARCRRQVAQQDFTTWERDHSTRCAPDARLVTAHPARHGAGAFAHNIVNPRSWLHLLRIVHYYSYTHVRERPKIAFGDGATIAPNVSITNGERISIGARSNIGAHCSLWAGDDSGRITIGSDVMLAPNVFVTASNYTFSGEAPINTQPHAEADVTIGDDVWLGANVVVLAGVTIADACVVGAGSVVTRSLEPGSIAVGCPARVVRRRSSASDSASDSASGTVAA